MSTINGMRILSNVSKEEVWFQESVFRTAGGRKVQHMGPACEIELAKLSLGDKTLPPKSYSGARDALLSHVANVHKSMACPTTRPL
jgi:hypothetical protein